MNKGPIRNISRWMKDRLLFCSPTGSWFLCQEITTCERWHTFNGRFECGPFGDFTIIVLPSRDDLSTISQVEWKRRVEFIHLCDHLMVGYGWDASVIYDRFGSLIRLMCVQVYTGHMKLWGHSSYQESARFVKDLATPNWVINRSYLSVDSYKVESILWVNWRSKLFVLVKSVAFVKF
jgi:hypothetical protein